MVARLGRRHRVVLRVLSDIEDDGFCEAVLSAHSILVPEELGEAEASFKECGSVTECQLNRLPQSKTIAV